MGRGGSLGYDGGAKVYVGGLRYGATERDVERMFDKYGPIERIFVARRPPGFAFVHFSREEDAEEAVRRCDGRELNGHSIRVEMSHGRRTNRKAWWRRDSRSRSRSSSRGRDRRVRRDSRSRSRSPRRDTRSRSKSVRRDTRRSPSYSSYDAERRK
ncbi:probable splicing factor, arginine/serine-rich 6 isoform X3 [Varroa jacobsoni]|uniref:RRM domain-containing protein n=1 Tax=Varroa destructor TaxID=109461 RepID=A0A7M7JT56_VARDE|nr:probable splicing factor, arginine/serine-rich 6 isoform X3 [Varroa destructor]XP_022693092.1 probable splicing factor, arginine/serine-rich 6 isoform X3 [Varroa jacobsoni]